MKLQRNLPLVSITCLLVINFGYKAAWGNRSSDEGSKMRRLLPASSSTMLIPLSPADSECPDVGSHPPASASAVPAI